MADDDSLVRYFVRQGDFLTKLAHRYGFSASEVWNLPENAELKAKRPNMDILLPGDVLYFPAKGGPGLPLNTGSSNSFTSKRPTIKVSLVLTEDGKPLANAPYVVHGLKDPLPGSTGSDGRVSVEVPVDTARIELHFPTRNEIYPILIGHMDPATERSGAAKRLDNLGYLGYYHSTEAAYDDAFDDAGNGGNSPFVEALMRFQTDNAQKHGLSVTGALDADTAKVLESEHGS